MTTRASRLRDGRRFAVGAALVACGLAIACGPTFGAKCRNGRCVAMRGAGAF